MLRRPAKPNPATAWMVSYPNALGGPMIHIKYPPSSTLKPKISGLGAEIRAATGRSGRFKLT